MDKNNQKNSNNQTAGLVVIIAVLAALIATIDSTILKVVLIGCQLLLVITIGYYIKK
jgi:hypothetical protein